MAWCWPHIPGPGEVPGFTGPANGTHDGRPVLSVPWRTLAGQSGQPGQLTRIGAITAQTARELAQAAAADPRCEWRILVTDSVGRLLTVTRIRSPGRGRASPRPPGSPAPPGPGPAPGSGVLGQITVTVPVTILAAPPPVASTETASGPGTALQAALTKALARPGRLSFRWVTATPPTPGQRAAIRTRRAVTGFRGGCAPWWRHGTSTAAIPSAGGPRHSAISTIRCRTTRAVSPAGATSPAAADGTTG